MTDTQNQILITDFTNQLNHEAQQMTSMFRGLIPEKQVTGDIFESQLLGSGSQKDVTTRNQTIEFSAPDHQRRGAETLVFYDAIPIDRTDELRSIVDIKSGYAKQMAMSAMRKLDHVVADAALGSVLTGKNFTSSVTAANDGVQTVTAGSGLVYDKLREVKQKMNSSGAGLYGDKIYVAMTEVQESTLLDEIEVISNDYNVQRSAETGKITSVLGMGIIVFPSAGGESIINKVSTTRECFAFTEDALELGMLSDFEVRYERRPDLVDTHQLVITSRYAALRKDGKKVIKINVTE